MQINDDVVVVVVVSQRGRYCDARCHAVCVSVHRAACSGFPRRISLGGEGNAPYPVLSVVVVVVVAVVVVVVDDDDDDDGDGNTVFFIYARNRISQVFLNLWHIFSPNWLSYGTMEQTIKTFH